MIRRCSSVANGRPVTRSISSPATTYPVFEYAHAAPGTNDGGWFSATATSSCASHTRSCTIPANTSGSFV